LAEKYGRTQLGANPGWYRDEEVELGTDNILIQLAVFGFCGLTVLWSGKSIRHPAQRMEHGVSLKRFWYFIKSPTFGTYRPETRLRAKSEKLQTKPVKPTTAAARSLEQGNGSLSSPFCFPIWYFGEGKMFFCSILCPNFDLYLRRFALRLETVRISWN